MGSALPRVRRVLAILAVVAAGLGGALTALGLYNTERDLGVGRVNLSVALGHPGALDLYVPLVDWGARFPAVHMPARLKVEARSIDREAMLRLADGGAVGVDAVRSAAERAIESYIRELLAVMLLAGLAGGILVALTVRGGYSPRLRWLVALAVVTATAATAITYALLPPRGRIEHPQYYAYGSDIPRALLALEEVQKSGERLDDELNSQLVGLARLVAAPADRPPVDTAPKVTVASDLHNNVLALPILERAARGGPVLFPGDLTDRGTPLENALVRRIVRTGRPFVFVSGNHDSDTLVRQLVEDGAIVLHQDGQILNGGRRGGVVVDVAGLRVAGWGSSQLRRARDGYRDRYTRIQDPVEQAAFSTWIQDLVGKVDVVMVHNARVAETALADFVVTPPTQPLVILVGHSHKASLRRVGNVTVVDDGTIGAGADNLSHHAEISLAVLAFNRPFAPLAADLVKIDPGTGSATAIRERLDD